MTIADKIKTLRKSCNMTQEELADKINVSRQTISKWETNVSIPDIESIIKICKLFSISTDELLDYKQNSIIRKRQFIIDMVVLGLGLLGFIIFGILMLTNKIDAESSIILINGYGIMCIVFIILIIAIIIIIIKRYGKK